MKNTFIFIFLFFLFIPMFFIGFYARASRIKPCGFGAYNVGRPRPLIRRNFSFSPKPQKKIVRSCFSQVFVPGAFVLFSPSFIIYSAIYFLCVFFNFFAVFPCCGFYPVL